MNFAIRKKVVFLALMLSFSLLRLDASAATTQKPNIIFILADDLGYGDIGCYGQKVIRTPRIDRMAREGMRFTQFYAGATVCAPSRSVLMTGQHQGHTRVRGNAGKKAPIAQALRTNDVTVAKILHDVGYTTALIGKWGLGEAGNSAECGLPRRQGFDYFFGYLNQYHAHNHYPDYLWRNEEKVRIPNGVKAVGDSGAGYATNALFYSDDLFCQEAVEFVQQNREKPFFLYWSMVVPHVNSERKQALHDGHEVPDHGIYADKDWASSHKGYAAMITRLDGYVGRMLDQLRQLGIAENTLVIFASDNGPETNPEQDLFHSSGPFRGYKRDLTDGGIRVPFVAWWPGKIAPGKTSRHVGYFADFMGSAAELAGASCPTATDSVSFLPTLLGKDKEQKQHDFLYWEFHERGFNQAALWQGRWKGIRLEPDAPLEVYDLATDLHEDKNVAQKVPEITGKLDAYLKTARSETPDWPVRKK